MEIFRSWFCSNKLLKFRRFVSILRIWTFRDREQFAHLDRSPQPPQQPNIWLRLGSCSSRMCISLFYCPLCRKNPPGVCPITQQGPWSSTAGCDESLQALPGTALLTHIPERFGSSATGITCTVSRAPSLGQHHLIDHRAVTASLRRAGNKCLTFLRRELWMGQRSEDLAKVPPH